MENENKQQVDLSQLPNEQLQEGIDANVQGMIYGFVAKLSALEKLINRPVDLNINTKLPDGRKVHIKIK